MKVLHVVPYFPPERVGGVGEFAAHLHRALLAAGHESVVVTAGRHASPPVHRIARSPIGWFLKTAFWVREAARADIVHCQSGEALPLILLLTIWPRRSKCLLTFHLSWKGIGESFAAYRIEGHEERGAAWDMAYRWLAVPLHQLHDAIALRCADAVNTVTRAAARDVLGEKRAETASVIYYGLEASGADGERADPVELLYCGVPGPRKRVMMLPYVLRRVRERFPAAKLRIVGFRLDEAPALHARFQAFGLLEAVENPGRMNSSALGPHYRAAKVLLLPSAYEGLPLVLLEAMHHGLPTVATNVSGHPEAIEHKVNGMLVPRDDAPAMADAVCDLLGDESLRARLGQAAQQTARQRFALDHMCRNYLALYNEILHAG